MSAPRTRPRRCVDRAGDRYGHFTAVACVGRTRGRRAVWSCRCDCGRPDCAEVVERTSTNLRKGERPDCRWDQRAADPPAIRRDQRAADPPAIRPTPATTLLPEGLRPPWSRSADERADRDAKLLGVFSRADLR